PGVLIRCGLYPAAFWIAWVSGLAVTPPHLYPVTQTPESHPPEGEPIYRQIGGKRRAVPQGDDHTPDSIGHQEQLDPQAGVKPQGIPAPLPRPREFRRPLELAFVAQQTTNHRLRVCP